MYHHDRGGATMTLQQHRLPELLSNYRILTAVIPHLLLKDFLNLIAVSRDVREAVSARSAQSSTEATDELQRLQHVLVLLSLTGRCKSPHKSAIRIGVGSCVWCGEGVCRVSELWLPTYLINLGTFPW